MSDNMVDLTPGTRRTGMTRIANQDAPAEMVGVTVADGLVVHGWDVAQAAG